MPDTTPRMPQPNANRPATGTATVTVGCKLPHGIYINGDVEEEVLQDVMGGGKRTVKEYRPGPERWLIKGTAVPLLRDPDVEYPLIVNGAAITFGVPADIWDAWLAKMKNHAMVRNGSVFAAHDERDVRAWARDTRDIKTGMEPIRQDGDERMPSNVVKAVAA